ncbi:hypothetical protein GCM10018793_01640 [Streptomyces sulfonofaciens]|uniref:Uncharacterized protein n=1 Tax=Streptomyces sulfonofaciens TaxID=68272 RepID=A0A919KQG8_9ACTN|nr:hypothetical protein [Streptomyces sulfonofaciens]GHH69340.1 hypothetical protein GCM10018793_01640 [Streptomyces sulfonofaciens]
MTQGQGGWKRHGMIPASRRPHEDRAAEPVYTALLEAWRRQGRTLPGGPDPEWNAIVSRDFWPRGGSF